MAPRSVEHPETGLALPVLPSGRGTSSLQVPRALTPRGSLHPRAGNDGETHSGLHSPRKAHVAGKIYTIDFLLIKCNSGCTAGEIPVCLNTGLLRGDLLPCPHLSDKSSKRFCDSVTSDYNRLPREAVAAPSLSVSKARLDGALSNLIWWKMSLLMARGLEPGDL